jgi:hypothetical protein
MKDRQTKTRRGSRVHKTGIIEEDFEFAIEERLFYMEKMIV